MVARLPSSSPAAASTKAPEHNESTRAPAACASRKAAHNAPGTGASTPRQPGTITVPARASRSNPPSTPSVTPPAARSGPASAAATEKRYQSGPISGRGRPNTSTAQPNSKVHSPS